MNTELTTTNQTLQVTPSSVSAITPSEMEQAHHATLGWAESKIAELEGELDEARQAVAHAIKRKWSKAALERIADRLQKRVEFYVKMKEALVHGYCIVPNFPVTCFAIRTDRGKPRQYLTTSYGSSHEQKPKQLPQGEGEYKNPFPDVWQRTIQEYQAPDSSQGIKGKQEIKQYWAQAWKELEFPLTMAKPHLMEATDRAMALKIFDEIGILPETKDLRAAKGDPIIVGRIVHPFKKDGASPEWPRPLVRVAFLICWHLDLKELFSL